MEITIRHVLELSPEFAELLSRLLGGVVGARSGSGEAAPSVVAAGSLPQVPSVAVPAPAVASVPPTAKLPKGKPRWSSPARDAVLREHWPLNTPPDAIWALLVAAEPERPMPKVKDYIAQRAAYIGLKRPASRFAEKMAAARAARRGAVTVPEDIPAAIPAAAPAGPREALAVDQAPPPSQPAPVASAPRPPQLPPASGGKVYARFADIRAWAGFFGVPYDGGNLDRVNKLRAAKGLPPLVQDDTAAPAVREAA
jgi:hypothetical protein